MDTRCVVSPLPHPAPLCYAEPNDSRVRDLSSHPVERASLMEARTMMNLIVWLVAGAVIGWLAGVVMHDRSGLLVNIVVGVVGALIAGFLLNRPTINQSVFNLNALVISLIGAIVLLAAVNSGSPIARSSRRRPT